MTNYNYNYKCVVAKNGSKRYYKNVSGKWKRISNKSGEKAEKGKKKYGMGAKSDAEREEEALRLAIEDSLGEVGEDELYEEEVLQKTIKASLTGESVLKEGEYLVEKIMGKRTKKLPGKGTITEFLVKWEGYPHSENTWEPKKEIKHTIAFIDFQEKNKPNPTISKPNPTISKPNPSTREKAKKVSRRLTKEEKAKKVSRRLTKEEKAKKVSSN